MMPWVSGRGLKKGNPKARQKRSLMHKTIKVLNCLSKSAQAKVKGSLHDIWQAESKADAEKACEMFNKMYEPKYPKAAICLQKDRDEMLAFYDFPAQHWLSIRTGNPIKSSLALAATFQTFKRCLSRNDMLHMMLKLGQRVEKMETIVRIRLLDQGDNWGKVQRCS